MNEQTPMYGSPDGQHPHVPGHDPLGSGLPRQQEARQAQTEASADDTASEPVDDDAPLGGDENTEDQLTADTAVERDALKSLDPDDTPA
ncbi:hypothetical protein ACIPV2_10885 [Microbacterium sp. NPDC089987]|uniref:hypothetical protein n=1 Tax=Microbacterium sp. NPDC089987 TaxID=3364202 RepID=UPI00380BB308